MAQSNLETRGGNRRNMQPRHTQDPALTLRSDIDRALEVFWRAFDLQMLNLVNASITGGEVMPVDMRETDSEVEVTAELPGLEPDEIEVSVTDDSITIRAEAEAEHDVSDDGYMLHERRAARFERTIPLPEGVDPESMQASYRNGVLTLAIPKTSDAPNGSRRIAVQSG